MRVLLLFVTSQVTTLCVCFTHQWKSVGRRGRRGHERIRRCQRRVIENRGAAADAGRCFAIWTVGRVVGWVSGCRIDMFFIGGGITAIILCFDALLFFSQVYYNTVDREQGGCFKGKCLQSGYRASVRDAPERRMFRRCWTLNRMCTCSQVKAVASGGHEGAEFELDIILDGL